jgi:adenylate kinase family enzyme
MNFRRLHIVGASGSGTTTLGQALATALGYRPFDADHYYWLPTQPPFKEKRDPAERLRFILNDLSSCDRSIVSGSVVGWGEELESGFDLIVFLSIPRELRLARLRSRELLRSGFINEEFITWAAGYDDDLPQPVTRNRRRHEAWLAARTCSILRLDGDLTVPERVAEVLAHGRSAPAQRVGLPSESLSRL